MLFQAVRRGPSSLVGVAAGLLAYAAQELALFPVAELDPVVWLLAGVVVARVCSETIELRAPKAGRIVVVGVVAALAVVAAIAGGRDILADRATRSALASLAVGDGPAAERQAARAVALRPDQIEYRLAAARADAAPDTPSAIDVGLADLRAALRVSPGDPVLLDEQGRLLLERALRSGAPADLAVARTDLQHLVTRDPLNAADQLRLGVAAATAGDNEGARQAWLAADRLAPSSAAAATDLASLYATERRWPDAAAAARRALARDPANAEAKAIANESAKHLGT
jgi:tetratricopeptide (TPR) repeat protein